MNTPAAGLAQDAALNIVPPSEVSLQAGLLMRQRHILYRRIDALLPEDCCVLRSMQGGTVGSLYQWEPGLDFARATLSGEPVACDILHNAILPVLPGSGWCAEKFR